MPDDPSTGEVTGTPPPWQERDMPRYGPDSPHPSIATAFGVHERGADPVWVAIALALVYGEALPRETPVSQVRAVTEEVRRAVEPLVRSEAVLRKLLGAGRERSECYAGLQGVHLTVDAWASLTPEEVAHVEQLDGIVTAWTS